MKIGLKPQEGKELHDLLCRAEYGLHTLIQILSIHLEATLFTNERTPGQPRLNQVYLPDLLPTSTRSCFHS